MQVRDKWVMSISKTFEKIPALIIEWFSIFLKRGQSILSIRFHGVDKE